MTTEPNFTQLTLNPSLYFISFLLPILITYPGVLTFTFTLALLLLWFLQLFLLLSCYCTGQSKGAEHTSVINNKVFLANCLI